jgi:hypothetical protein
MEDLKKKTKEELNELVQKAAEGLSKTEGCKVFPLLLNSAGFDSTEGEWVVGYYKEASLFQCMDLFDTLNSGNRTLKGWQLIEKNLIKAHSDMKWFDMKQPKNKWICLGAALDAINNSSIFSLNQAEEIKKMANK